MSWRVAPSAEVSVAFTAFPPAERARLQRVRELVFDVATAAEGIGPLSERLKWGEPAYLTESSRSGSTVRLGCTPAGEAAIHFICHTRLMESFRELYPASLRYGGNRSILVDDKSDENALRHCIALALTYHLRKKRDGGSRA